MKNRVARAGAAAMVVIGAVSLAACSSNSGAVEKSGDGLTKVSVVLGWLPTAESGGFYAAQQLGYYKAHGLEVTIEPGGPAVSGTQLVASGKVNFGITGSGANEIVQAEDQGIPLKAVNAIFQNSDTGMMVHASTGITTLKQTNGMTWVNSPGVLGVEWAKKKLGITFKQQSYTGSIANFIHDDNLVQQGVASNEPYVAHEQGNLAVKFMPFADIGFNPYNTITYVTDKFLQSDRKVVKAFVEASNEGWRDYMGKVSVARLTNNYLVHKIDKTLDTRLLWFEWTVQRDYILTGDGLKKIGAMTSARWQTIINQMTQLGSISKKLSVSDVADLSITPNIAPLATKPDAPAGSYDKISD